MQPSDLSIDMAKQLFSLLFKSKLYPNRVSPAAEGGIAFIYLKEDNKCSLYADIEISDDGECMVAISDRTNPLFYTGIELEEAVKIVAEFLR